MPTPPPSEPTVDELMASIRAVLDSRDGPSMPGHPTQGSISPQPSLEKAQLLLDQAEQVADVGSKVPPFTIFGPVRRTLARLVTRVLLYFLQVLSVDQRVFNGLLLSSTRSTNTALQHLMELELATGERLTQVQHSLQGLAGNLKSLTGDVESLTGNLESLTGNVESLTGNLESLTGNLESLAGSVESLTGSVDSRVAELARALASARASTSQQERRLATLLAERRQGSPERPDSQPALVDARLQRHLWDALYADLEDRFRGTRDEIKRRLERYLPVIRQAKAGEPGRPIVDLGCGRGEWLELLGEHGLAARGVEMNTVMVQRCRDSGFEVVETEAIACLRSLPEQSVGAVTAFHLIEHLPHESLLALLDEVLRVLLPGGLAIFETPNPANVQVGSCTFYLDPTHRRPVPSQLLKFLAEARGLCTVEVVPLHPYPADQRIAGTGGGDRFDEYFYGPQDYAVIGYKA